MWTCIKEFPVLEKLYKKYKGNENVTFLIINSNMGNDTYDKALKFIKQNPYDLPFVIDIKGATSEKFKVAVLPTLIIIDKKGVIRLTHIGYEGSENFETKFCNQVNSLITENNS